MSLRLLPPGLLRRRHGGLTLPHPLAPADPYLDLEAWVNDATWIYNRTQISGAGPEIDATVGQSLVITGGAGWTPGSYVISQVLAGYNTGDGVHTMVSVAPAAAPAAAGTDGGTAHVA